MKKNYIILTHKNEVHIKRIIDILDDNESHFYIHIDKRKPLSQFEILKSPNVTLVEDRVCCYWADFSLVQGTLNCIKQLIKAKRVHCTILLTGQCYPIANKQYINKFFDNNVSDYITVMAIEEKRPDSYFKRIDDY